LFPKIEEVLGSVVCIQSVDFKKFTGMSICYLHSQL